MDIPPVERFQAGYHAGVKSVNPDCQVITVVCGLFNDQAKGKEATLALETLGVSVYKMRYGGIIISGLTSGLAGAYLAIENSTAFTEGMTNRRGFIALAANISGGWNPVGSFLASLFFGFADALQYRIQAISRAYHLTIDPDAKIDSLSVGLQQRVEILKALYRDAKILILDEPTAVLTPQEVEELFDVIRELRNTGVSIIIITHKLEEIMAIAQRVYVLRRGRLVGEKRTDEVTKEELANLMVGREVVLIVHKEEKDIAADPVFEINGLTIESERGINAVSDLSLTVKPGEIVGVAGVDGNGQREPAEGVMGEHDRDPFARGINLNLSAIASYFYGILLILGTVIMAFTGYNAVRAYRALFYGGFVKNWHVSLLNASPLIYTGLSVAFAFKAGLFNIGAEGQYMARTVQTPNSIVEIIKGIILFLVVARYIYAYVGNRLRRRRQARLQNA